MDSVSDLITPSKLDGKHPEIGHKEPTYTEILMSPIQLFIVGLELAAIPLHSAMVFHFSPKLKGRVDWELSNPRPNIMKLDGGDSSGDAVRLPEVKPDTFIRFAEWMHRGDYAAAHAVRAPKVGETDGQASTFTTPVKPRAVESGDGFTASSPLVIGESTETGRKRRRGHVEPTETTETPVAPPHIERAWANFENFDPQLGKFPRRIVMRVKNLAINHNPLTNYTEVFLSHAELCIFAIEWEVPALFIFAMEKLHRALITFVLYPQRVGDVVKLADYIYQNTACEEEQGMALRAMISRYVLAKSNELFLTEEYLNLVDRGGDLVKDMFRLVKQGSGEEGRARREMAR